LVALKLRQDSSRISSRFFPTPLIFVKEERKIIEQNGHSDSYNGGGDASLGFVELNGVGVSDVLWILKNKT
jgi:hypothetical protein